MKTILVDDEILALRHFAMECADIAEIEIVGEFDSPIEALEYARKHPVELAVLDIEMPEMDGISLGRELHAIHPDIILIFATAHEQHALNAYKLRAAAYLLKPYTREDILHMVRTASLLSAGQRKRVFIRTFGLFDVFVNGKPVDFKSAKAKELLALLVNFRGATINSRVATMYLWEGRAYDNATQSLYRKVTRFLHDTLKRGGIPEIIRADTFTRSVRLGSFDCDYYRLLEGDKQALDEFEWEYMSQYSWGEETLAKLTKLKPLE